jgi:hypothetical protein
MGDDPMALLGLEGALKHYYFIINCMLQHTVCTAWLLSPPAAAHDMSVQTACWWARPCRTATAYAVEFLKS